MKSCPWAHRIISLVLAKAPADGNWRKMKGIAHIRVTPGGKIHLAAFHWYEAHGIGKKGI